MSNDEFWESVELSVAELETRLELPRGFFEGLRDEPPWSFIIKSHALVEGAVGSVNSVALSKLGLGEWATTLPLHGRTSKVSLLRGLGELNPEDVRFIEALSRIRNRLVHRIKNVDFDYETYFGVLSDADRTKALRSLSYAHMGETVDDIDLGPIRTNPQKTIWSGLRLILAILSLRAGTREALHKGDRLRNEFAELSHKSNKSEA